MPGFLALPICALSCIPPADFLELLCLAPYGGKNPAEVRDGGYSGLF